MSKVAKDYLGHPSRNNEYQQIFKGQTPALSKRRSGCLPLPDFINSVTTWQLGSSVDYLLRMHCDDPIRKDGARGSVPKDLCPKLTLPEHYDRCTQPEFFTMISKTDPFLGQSRCWFWWRQNEGTENEALHWKPKALAYTTNRDRKRGDYINWCPEWFNLKTCNDAASKYSKDPDDYQRHNMVNYQCRGKWLLPIPVHQSTV